MVLVRGSLYTPASGNGGGGAGQIPPVALGPLPTVGAEGSGFAYQVNAIGTLPLSFALTDGAVPTGMTFDTTTGLITGTCVAPNGGLYNFTVEITNDYGSVSQAYAILIDGTAPSGSYTIAPVTDSLTGGVLNTWTPSVTGSTGGSPAVPFTYSFTATPDPLLNASIDSGTGVVTMTPDASLIGNSVDIGALSVSNYFGDVVLASGFYGVLATVYWGEWHGALPGTFTAANITTDLFDDATPGPRTKSGFASFQCFTENPFLVYPATGIAYVRILAVPHGLFTGSILADGGYPNFFLADLSNINVPCASLTPAWPTPYQSGLVINNVPYDIYVVTARTAAITLLGNSL